MPIKQDYIHEMCQGFTSFVEDMHTGLFIKYIFHHRGQRADAVELESRFFHSHPAGNIALSILKQTTNAQSSRFHGLAIETTQSMMGLKEQKNIIGLITINLDNHETTESALQEAYHLGWMAIDSARLLQHPKYKSLRSGPLIPKRSALNFAKASLQADVFSVLILANQGYDCMIKDIAHKRSLDALTPHINGTPWQYAYPLAYETTRHAWDNSINQKSRSYHFISTPLEYAASIGQTFTDEDFQQWWSFCKPAQKMAWHNETPENILSTALVTSEDPIIKVTSVLIKKCTGIKINDDIANEHRYNAFISEKNNNIYHEKAIQETFELVLSEGLKVKSAKPIFDLASKQNNELTNGRVFGWYASALQVAGRAFDKQQKSPNSSDIDIRNIAELGFKASQREIKYKSLLTLGDNILDRRKKGEIITMKDVETMAFQQMGCAFVGESVKETIKDPDYQKSLDDTDDLNRIYSPEVKPTAPTAAPKMAQQHAPQAAPNIAAGMGGGGMMGGNGQVAVQTTTQTDDTKKAE